MNTQLTDRPATLPQPTIDPVEITSSQPARPRRVWVAGVAIAALSIVGAAGVASRSSSSDEPAPSPAAASASVAVPAQTEGPNADLAPDWTCQRSPLSPACATPAVRDRATAGPNADLAPDWTISE